MSASSKSFSPLDLDTGRDILESLHAVTGVPCRLFDAGGALVIRTGAETETCVLCSLLQKTTGEAPHCELVHRHGAEMAHRFGGRYIYSCPSDMVYFSSPLMQGGQQVGALVCGPVLLMDVDDYLASSSLAQVLSSEDREVLRSALNTFYRAEPKQLSHFSNLLFAVAVYIGGSSLSLLRQQRQTEQQQTLGDFVQQWKNDGFPGEYPTVKERQLNAAVRAGDEVTARRRLEELMGFILYSTAGNPQEFRDRAVELLTMTSRAAMAGGASPFFVLNLNSKAMRELESARNIEDMTLSLSNRVEQYAGLISDIPPSKHRKVLRRALNYIRQNYMRPIGLEEVAAHVGMSPNYFSSIFRKEKGCSFRHYLNQVRVENSQVLLLASPELSILQICNMCGFEDQAYFVKVFQRHTGTTPSRFRIQHSRILREKERSTED